METSTPAAAAVQGRSQTSLGFALNEEVVAEGALTSSVSALVRAALLGSRSIPLLGFPALVLMQQELDGPLGLAKHLHLLGRQQSRARARLQRAQALQGIEDIHRKRHGGGVAWRAAVREGGGESEVLSAKPKGPTGFSLPLKLPEQPWVRREGSKGSKGEGSLGFPAKESWNNPASPAPPKGKKPRGLRRSA
jgi:hypothetical protein